MKLSQFAINFMIFFQKNRENLAFHRISSWGGHVEIRFPNGGSCGNLISFQQCHDDFTNFLMYGNFTMTVTYTNSYRNINLKCSPCLLSIYSLTIVHSKVATDRTSDQSRIRSLDGKKSVNQKEMLGNVGSTLELAFYAKKLDMQTNLFPWKNEILMLIHVKSCSLTQNGRF